MSELIKFIPELFIVGKDGRFRTIAINWKNKNVNDYINLYKED